MHDKAKLEDVMRTHMFLLNAYKWFCYLYSRLHQNYFIHVLNKYWIMTVKRPRSEKFTWNEMQNETAKMKQFGQFSDEVKRWKNVRSSFCVYLLIPIEWILCIYDRTLIKACFKAMKSIFITSINWRRIFCNTTPPNILLFSYNIFTFLQSLPVSINDNHYTPHFNERWKMKEKIHLNAKYHKIFIWKYS